MAAGPTRVRLDEAMDQIVDYAHDVTTAATAGNGLLAGVTQVVKGDRARVRPEPPYLWVMVGAATATQPRAMHETWEAALMLNAFVLAEEPEDGWMAAMRYAARARSVVLADRTFGSGLRFVEDAQSAELGPLGQFRHGRRFGAYARVNVRFALVEPEVEV